MKKQFFISSMVLLFTNVAMAENSAETTVSTKTEGNTPINTFEGSLAVSTPDTTHTSLGFSYGNNIRGFASLDFQDIPAHANKKENSYEAISYTAGATLKGKFFGVANLAFGEDILIRYTKANSELDRGSFWGMGIQPKLSVLGEKVAINFGLEYRMNFIVSKSTAQQEKFAKAGVTTTSLAPVLSFDLTIM